MGLGWLASLTPLVSTTEAAVRAKTSSPSVRPGSGPEIEPVTTSLSSALEEKKPPPSREKLQPPENAPIRNRVTVVPKGRIADRPMPPHALYRLGSSALWDAGLRNAVLRT